MTTAKATPADRNGGTWNGGLSAFHVIADSRRVSLRLMGWLLPAWAVAAFTGIYGGTKALALGTTFIAIAILLAGCYVAWYLVRRDRQSLLTPLPLAFTMLAFSFGFGPLLSVFYPDSIYATARYRIIMDETGLFDVQMLNLVGTWFMLGGMFAASAAALSLVSRAKAAKEMGDGATSTAPDRDRFGPFRFAESSLMRGYIAFTVLTFVVRSLRHIGGVNLVDHLPSFLNAIDTLGYLAVFLGAILATRRGGLYWLLPVVPLTIDVIDGFLELRKSRILTPVLFFFLGTYIGGKPMRFLVGGVVFCTALFIAIYPVVDAGREAVWRQGSVSSIEYFATQFASENVDEEEAIDLLHAWARWNLAPVQYFLIREYDAGRVGQTYSELPWFFVPRSIAPNKPVLDFGARLNEQLYGHRRSASGSTVFGEAYWNGGWPLVLLTSFLTGVLLFVNAIACLWLFNQKSILTWPVGLMGILTGQLLQNNFFTVGLVGLSIIFLGLTVGLSIFLRAGTPHSARIPDALPAR